MAEPYPIPGTMIVDAPQADTWEETFEAYRRALIDLNGDGIPDAVVPQGRMSDAGRRRATVAGINPREPEPGQEAGVAAALMVPGAPIRSVLAGLGAAYGYAAGSDLGLWGASPAEAQGKKRTASAEPASTAPSDLPPDLAKRWQELTARQQKDRWLPPAERDELKGLNNVAAEAARGRAAGKTEEFNRSVRTAEGARDTELARNRRFSDTATGKLWEKTGGAAPLLAGLGAGMVGRMASGGGSAIKNYLAPAVEGAFAGATASNIPLAYNAFFTEPDNPERRAYDAYSRELPPDHPRKAEWSSYAQNLPQENPIRKVARDEFFNPLMAAERMGFGAIEGVGGGLMGSGIVRAPGMIAEGLAGLPGRLRGASGGNKAAPTNKPSGAEPPAGPPEPPPPPPQSFPTYPALPESYRRPVQEAYIADRALRGGDLPPKQGAAAIKNSLLGQNVQVPVTPSRVAETNRIIEAFVAQNGRLPTAREFSQVFTNKTLAVPAGLAASGPVNALLSNYYGDGQ